MVVAMLVATPVSALMTLTDDRSRFDLHENTTGLWLDNWHLDTDRDWPDGRLNVPSAGWSEDIYHWSATINNESSQRSWYLVIRNPSIDLLRVYTNPDEPERYIQLSDYQAPGQRLLPGSHFVVPLDFPEGQRQTLYITATSDDWQFYPMMLVDRTGYQMFSQQETLFVGAMTGLLLALFLFNLLQTLLKGHWSFVWVAISAIAWTLQLWFWYGLGYLWLWPNSPWLQNHLWYLLVPITGVSVLGSVIAAISTFLRAGEKWLLYSTAIGGFFILLGLQLVLPNHLYLLVNWLWFTLGAILVLIMVRRTRALQSLHLLLLGYIALSGTFFGYMAWSPVLHNTVMVCFLLVYLVLTSMHSFIIYWQYNRNRQKLWQELKDRSRAFEDVAGEQQEQLEHYRSAAQLGRTWRSTFTQNIADRFAVVEQAVQTLRQTVRAEERQSALKDAHRASREGLNYVEDLVSLERLLTREYAIEQETFSLHTWLAQFDHWFDQEATTHQVFFRSEIVTADLPTVTGPANTLRIILMRFLENALRFTDSGFIKVLVEAEGHTRQRIDCRFEVRDSGTGLSEDMVAAIQAFWAGGTPVTAERPDGETHGLGSGLTIALFLLHQLGARFDVQSTPGAGTSMRFWLWLDRAQNSESRPPVEHWLLVDESPALYDEARQQLSSGVDVHWVKNGQVALSALRGTQFDVIIIGLNAAVIDGIEFTRLCRDRDDLNRQAWIIGMRDEQDSNDPLHATQAGMNDVLERPASEAEQRAWFRQLIRRLYHEADPPSPLS